MKPQSHPEPTCRKPKEFQRTTFLSLKCNWPIISLNIFIRGTNAIKVNLLIAKMHFPCILCNKLMGKSWSKYFFMSQPHLSKCLSCTSFPALCFGSNILQRFVLLSQRHKLMRIISARVSITRPSPLYTDTLTHSWSLDKRGKSDGIVLSLTASFTDARGLGLGPVWTVFNAPVTHLFVQFPETLFDLRHVFANVCECECWS